MLLLLDFGIWKCFMPRVRRVRPRYRQKGLSCTTIHRHTFRLLCWSFWLLKGFFCSTTLLTPQIYLPLTIFFLKLHLKKTAFNGILYIQATASDYFTHIAKAAFQKHFDGGYIPCKKCVESSSDYFE